MARRDVLSIRDARDTLSQLVRRVEDGEVITITRRGRPVAVLVHVEDWEAFERWVDARDLEAAVAARTEERVTLEEAKAQLGL